MARIKRLGSTSKPHSLADIDQRTRAAALLRRVRADLTAHVGGNPSATEKLLIERLAKVALRLELYDRKIEAGIPITDHDSRTFAALHGSFRLMLRQLGMKATEPRAPTLADIIAKYEDTAAKPPGKAA